MKIQKFLPNTKGKDIVCSDIHGHFSLLENQLETIGFSTERDRLFCLGDLIDRGDESSLVLEYLSKPWFHSILGNHELMLVDAFESGSYHVRSQWNFWGGDWAEDFDDDTLERYYEALVGLPIGMEVMLGESNKAFGLIHAELPEVCDWNDVVALLSDKGVKDNTTNPGFIHGMLWNKDQVLSAAAVHGCIRPVENIEHVFHGHTIVDKVTTISNRTFMDLGSYRSGVIGLINPVDFLISGATVEHEQLS